MMNSRQTPRSQLISVIVPLYNEADNVRPLYDALAAALDTSTYRFEIILVDDGSTDDTASIAETLTSLDGRLHVLKLRRNYGQTSAMSAGIDYAHGEILVTIDGDLQNDPTDIPKLVEVVESGADLAVGWRRNRKDDTISRILPSRVANWLIAKVTGVNIKDNGCSLKAYRASVIKKIPLYSEMHRFIPAMSTMAGARIEQIAVKHHERHRGESKYGIGRTWRVLFDLLSIKTIIAFTSRPLLWFTALAFIPTVLATITGTYAIFNYLESSGVANIVPTGIALQFMALAVFLVACGVIGEYSFRSGDTREHRFAYLTAKTLISYRGSKTNKNGN